MSTSKHNLYINADVEEEIVISGIAGRFPNTDNLKDFQEKLFNKVDLGSYNHGRWNASYNMPHRIGKINNIEKFDSYFFNVPATEAHVMDPIIRILLEHTYEAIIDAGVNPKELRGTRTGVFTANIISDSAHILLYLPQFAGETMIGCHKGVIANRISYWLGVTGPSYNIDSACSSSLFAINEAYRQIRSGKCDAAIVASGNLCLHPYAQLGFYYLGVLSSDGFCKPFDEEGTGYMRSDTGTVVYLQKAKDARRIYATLIHSKTNCDGFKEEGVAFPSFETQKMLMEEFYEKCGISPNELSYLEAHATGTLAGDPVEVMSIDHAICTKRKTPLLVGSVKANIGHSEPSSGLCQIAKILIAMETGIIPPTMHLKHPRKSLTSIIEGRIKIVTEPTEWTGGYVGVNSFGFGGANCHILLKSNPKQKINNGAPNDNLPRLVTVSGRTEEAVRIILNNLRNRPIDTEYISLLHHIHSDNIENHHFRGYLITKSKIPYNIINKVRYPYMRRPICFIFSGLDSQWFGMSRTLIKFSAFAKAIQKCNNVLSPYDIDIIDILTNENKNISDNIIDLILGLVGLQIGIVDLLTSIGIIPDFIIGHSVGELVCGYADGCLTVEETILSAYFIGLALHESKIIKGSMAEINLDLKTMQQKCPSNIDIACYNSSFNFIVSGPTDSVKKFVAELRASNISVKEISCGNVPFHSRYIEPAIFKIEEYLNRILLQKRYRSSKWLTTSAHECSNTLLPLCLKYYTYHLLSPVLFAKAISLIPKNTVTMEISPQNILQHILKRSLHSTLTNITLYECTEGYSEEIFLETVGKLYNAGLQPQIANLYPTVEFPVSRSTPMISPLIRWNHSKNYYVIDCNERIKVIKENQITVRIDINDEDYRHLTGHVVNEKNLIPAMEYLFLIWEMITSLRKRDLNKVAIVFEDVNFIRATVLSQHKVDLIVSIQKDNRFEITEGDNLVVTGIARIPNNIETEKISINLVKYADEKEEMSTKDIYKELRLRGYQYTGVFRGLKSATVTGSNGHIAWLHNWVAFMDNMLQIMILGQNSRSLFVPTRIRKLIIDPIHHIKLIQSCPIEDRQFSVRHYKSLDVIISGGIEICGIVATPIYRRQKAVNTVLEEYKFVAHRDLQAMSLQDAIKMSVHIALECYNMTNVKIIEFVDDRDEVTLEDLNYLFINKIFNDLPQIRHHIKLVTNHKKFENISLPSNVFITEITKLSRDEKCLMIIGIDILTKNSKKLYQQLLPLLMPQGFLLTLEESDAIYDYSCIKTLELDVIMEKQVNDKTFVLLRKTQNVAINKYQIIHVNNYEFTWVEELKLVMNEQNQTKIDTRIVLVAEDFECGLLGLINCLRKEANGEIIRSVFIQDDKAPTFSLQEPLYIKQLYLDLPINVVRSGNLWGSYRHFPLQSLELKPVENAYVTQKVHGDLSTLCWVQNEMPFCNEHENIINVIYASVNFKDIMIATGRLSAESDAPVERDNDCLIGMEFVGFDTRGQRIMGMCSHGGLTNVRVADKYLSWIIPEKWTMEDAATVPCVYSTCYYALYIKGKMKKGDKVLIHSGTGGIGQAAIYLALYEGCEVFTTVGTAEKQQFIRETFPSIPKNHIGNSRDTSFEQMIMQCTKGRGVDIVLNSLAEEKLQASIRCLAKSGRFLEIGKFDMISNNSLDISIFCRGIRFYSTLLDKLFYANTEQRTRLWKRITKGLKNGAIKPLCRKVFAKNEIEDAFRHMATGKHIGKVIIKVHEENDSLNAPLLAHPRYYCQENKCYIILGGLGGFGLELADWLILRGARNLILTSRIGIRTGYQRSRVKLWRSNGVDVQIIIVDDTLKHEDCESILKLAEERAPVDAIFNLAVVLKDCVFENQSPQTFEDSFKPKAWMTKKMDELSKTICPQLRHFVVFSSVSCGRGNAGQTNYGMANSVMERICEKRMAEGLHGLAIQWGAIGDVGLVADMQENNEELVIGGTLQQRISSCLNILDIFMLQNQPIVSSMVVAEKANIGGFKNIYETVADIMGLKNVNAVAHNISLAELGIDSMMATEIMQVLEREFDISLLPQDIRNLNFAKLKQMTNAIGQGEVQDTNKINMINTSEANISQHLNIMIKNSDIVPDILIELAPKKKGSRGDIFLIPGIEGCSTVFTSIASEIKSSAICLQHGAINIPDQTHSVTKSATYLLPYILEKMVAQREFLIVGYSFGSLIAIELARLLEAKNFWGRLILIDGSPDQMKFWAEKYFFSTSQQELQNVTLIGLMDIYNIANKKMFSLELDKCNTWEEKLKVFHTFFPEELNILSTENQNLICSTIYEHIIAIQNYNVNSVPRLKSPITLIKPTLSVISFIEEDYGLNKVTEGKVQIHYVEGTHITIMDNNKITSIINEEWTEE